MTRFQIIVILLIIFILLVILQNKLQNKSENLENAKSATNLSNEAIQNISSVYANTSGEAVFNKIKSTTGITGNLKGNVEGNLTGDVTSSSVKSKFINTEGIESPTLYGKSIVYSASGKIKEDANRMITAYSKSEDVNLPGYIYMVPRKKDNTDWNWTNEIKFRDNGDIDVPGILKPRAIVGGSTTINWDQKSFTEYAATQFKKSDPDGTHKTFIFRKSGTNNVWIISFIKIENYISGYRHHQHGNFKDGSTDWHREITNE